MNVKGFILWRLGVIPSHSPYLKFKVGTGFSDHQREHPPAINSIITYKFQELTDDGVPRFPVFVGERIDMDAPKDAVIIRKSGDADEEAGEAEV